MNSNPSEEMSVTYVESSDGIVRAAEVRVPWIKWNRGNQGNIYSGNASTLANVAAEARTKPLRNSACLKKPNSNINERKTRTVDCVILDCNGLDWNIVSAAGLRSRDAVLQGWFADLATESSRVDRISKEVVRLICRSWYIVGLLHSPWIRLQQSIPA